MIEATKLNYRAFKSKTTQGEWRAEACDPDGDGDCFVVIFGGPEAQQRAEEYAAWKNAG